MMEVRRAQAEDLEAIGSIQEAAPEAAQWPPRDYLSYSTYVAVRQGAIAGFVVVRSAAPDEHEVLNLATHPGHRRRQVAATLLSAVRAHHPGALFLEVRESNTAARAFYRAAGFRECGRRPAYYVSPSEDAILLTLV